MFRIGIGNDTHRLVEGRALMLGGVRVPHDGDGVLPFVLDLNGNGSFDAPGVSP